MAHSTAIDTCPGCAAKVSPGSRFCSRCGTRLQDGETLEIKPGPLRHSRVPAGVLTESPPAIHQVHRRPMGVHPVPLLGAFGAVGLILAIVLLANGSLVAGLILLGLAIAASALFFGGVSREPDAPAAAFFLRAGNRVRALSGMAGVGARAWMRAALELTRIRLRQLRLRRELKAGLAPLGDAVRQGDDRDLSALRRRRHEHSDRLAEAFVKP